MTTRRDEPQPDDVGIEELLRQVGARNEPSPEMEREVFAAVHAEWRTLVDDRQRKRRLVGWSMAASFAAVVLIATFGLREMLAPPAMVATIVRVDGASNVAADDGEAAASKVGEQIAPGQRVSTGADGRATLVLGDRLSLRLDRDTTVRFASNDHVTLESGTVYVDDPPSKTRTPLTVDSDAGSVTHVGTQYIVHDTTAGIEVSVREGRVLVTNSVGTNAGVAGEQLRVTNAGEVSRARIEPTDDLWTWAEQSGPTFDINEQSLASFLSWVARETGRKVVYESSTAEAAAGEAKLHGSIAGLDLDTALATVLSTTQLRQYPAGDDRIGIRLAASTAAK